MSLTDPAAALRVIEEYLAMAGQADDSSGRVVR
jgi:hypothetical protein